MDDSGDESFDAVLANLKIPGENAAPAPKIPKVQSDATLKRKPDSQILQGNDEAKNANNAAAIAKTATTNPYCVLVHSKQRGNPILKSIGNVPLDYRDDILADYVVGRTTCILYLSLKYHNLNPDYICQRLKQLGKQYELRVLLAQIDIPEPHNALKSLTRISLLGDLTLMLAWNAEEAGKIIETYKVFEKRPPDLIMERVDSNPHQKLVTALTNIKPVNKTDAVTLLQNFGNLENIINASEERLSQIMGLGPRKAKKLFKTLQEPFLSK